MTGDARARDGTASSLKSDQVDRVARLLIAEWERVERRSVNVSCIATFADMARVVIADRRRTPSSTLRSTSPECDEVDRVARLLIAEWERVEQRLVNVSYIATFVDMARAVIADRGRTSSSTEDAT